MRGLFVKLFEVCMHFACNPGHIWVVSWLGHKNFASESYDFWALPHHWISSVDKNSPRHLTPPWLHTSWYKPAMDKHPIWAWGGQGEWGLVGHHFQLTIRCRCKIYIVKIFTSIKNQTSLFQSVGQKFCKSLILFKFLRNSKRGGEIKELYAVYILY